MSRQYVIKIIQEFWSKKAYGNRILQELLSNKVRIWQWNSLVIPVKKKQIILPNNSQSR